MTDARIRARTRAEPIRLWGRSTAFNVQKVLWLLGELELSFEHVEVGGRFGGLDSDAIKLRNPHRRVPVLEEGDTVVWESHTILRYLAARHGAPALWHTDPAARSQVERWMDWSQCSLQPPFMQLFWCYYRTPEPRRNPSFIGPARAECARHLDLLDGILAAQPYLGGSAFSLADIPAGATLYRYLEMGLEVPRPAHVMSWYGRLSERPAYRRWIMSPFEELRGRLDF